MCRKSTDTATKVCVTKQHIYQIREVQEKLKK
jgi:hypothetical protein